MCLSEPLSSREDCFCLRKALMAWVMTFCSLLIPSLEGFYWNCRYLDPGPSFELEIHAKCCLVLSDFCYLKCAPFANWMNFSPFKSLWFFLIPVMKTLDILFIMLHSWSHCNWLLIQSLSKTSLKEQQNLLGAESSLLWHKPGVTLFNISFKEFLVRTLNLKIPRTEINLDSF